MSLTRKVCPTSLHLLYPQIFTTALKAEICMMFFIFVLSCLEQIVWSSVLNDVYLFMNSYTQPILNRLAVASWTLSKTSIPYERHASRKCSSAKFNQAFLTIPAFDESQSLSIYSEWGAIFTANSAPSHREINHFWTFFGQFFLQCQWLFSKKIGGWYLEKQFLKNKSILYSEKVKFHNPISFP